MGSCDCRKHCTSWAVQWRAFTLFWIVVLYLIIGGAIFVALERPAEIEREDDAKQQIQKANETIFQTIKNASNITDERAQNLTNRILSTLSELAPAVTTVTDALSPTWEIGPAIFFATTVVTTIGYGNISPSTPGGQAFFICYAIIGIPIALFFFATLGTIMSNMIEFVLRRVKTKRPTLLKICVFTAFAACGLVLFILIPSIIFAGIEDWTYRQAVYYCFVSLTTVGFGDFVPGEAPNLKRKAVRGVYKICVASWILIGIAFIALLIAELQKLITTASEAIGKVCMKRKAKGEATEEHKPAGDISAQNAAPSEKTEITLEADNNAAPLANLSQAQSSPDEVKESPADGADQMQPISP